MQRSTLHRLAAKLDGECHTDLATRILYATDASAYSEMPLAVVTPRSVDDLKKLIGFASREGTSLIPRTAGTSLAGQVVGQGIVVDVSRHFTRILDVNADERWVRVQPGVVRDELNDFLRPRGFFFAPETSTSNRAMIGGMVGNNSCGSNSVVYKSTREHVLSLKALLSDGSEAEFAPLNRENFFEKCTGSSREAALYQSIYRQLSNQATQEEIGKEFPKSSIERRNTGYAVDLLLDSAPFAENAGDFNFCKLLAGSEGTLAFITEIQLNLTPLPDGEQGLLCVHFHSIDDALRANLIALKYRPEACELIDHFILECTKDNIGQRPNRSFVLGDPQAILIVACRGRDRNDVTARAKSIEEEMREHGLGYHFPLLLGDETEKVWSLRKAGLGLLGNLPGDAKAVPVIEDTAVDVNDLPAYIRDFNRILKKHGLSSVHYAHAGSGELHLRPILNLKTDEGITLFRQVAEDIARLVKKYKGSLSGEHGDGRLRGEFIRQMVGENIYELFREIKHTWDPQHIFNPGKITDTPPMDTMLRVRPDQPANLPKTIFRFSGQTILQHTEQCNGTGDCRKSHLIGGTMCPSYMATRNEKDTTRARANILRTFLTNSTKSNPFDHPEIKEVMDLCISCKGCKRECPSSVDMAKLKAEFLQHYQDAHGVPLRSRIIASFDSMAKVASLVPALYNLMLRGRGISWLVKKSIGFSARRSMPPMSAFTLREWVRRQAAPQGVAPAAEPLKRVYLFCDEFTNYLDTPIGVKAFLLLQKLGYTVMLPRHLESGRASISKGLLRKARKIAQKNVALLSPLISDATPLVGIEPSAILAFRDEYPDLVGDDQLDDARKLAAHSFLIEEFLASEISRGRIRREQFDETQRLIKFHAHCQQKAANAVKSSVEILSFPANHKVGVIPSGCCGMAGSFGYETEHYDVSMKIANLVLLPDINRQPAHVIIAANGTSCRHQILDGTGKHALHPVEVLYDALK